MGQRESEGEREIERETHTERESDRDKEKEREMGEGQDPFKREHREYARGGALMAVTEDVEPQGQDSTDA